MRNPDPKKRLKKLDITQVAIFKKDKKKIKEIAFEEEKTMLEVASKMINTFYDNFKKGKDGDKSHE